MKRNNQFQKLRKYQTECVAACRKIKCGRIILPTASGKTVIALEVIGERLKDGDSKIFVIFVPRIMLAKQWIRKAGEVLLGRKKFKINIVNVNSGGVSSPIRKEIEESLHELGFPVKPIVSTTNSTEIRAAVEFLRKDGSSVIIICTYHSCQTLLLANLPVDTMVADESHFIVSDSAFFDCTRINAERKYYMTATPRFTDSDQGIGMNNESVYGPVIYEKKPVEMILAGAIVPPRIHVVTTDTDLNGSNYNAIMELTKATFLRHRHQVETSSAIPEKIGAKLLVICDGQKTLEGLLESKAYRRFIKEQPNVHFFGLSTDYGIMINGQYNKPPVTNAKKEEFLLALGHLGADEEAIIFHVDMVGEGLDVPAITGIFMLRNCGKIKFLQNQGRAARLHPGDLERLNKGALKLKNYEKYIKPECYVCLPYCLQNKDDFLERLVRLVKSFKEDFDFDPSETVVIDLLHSAQQGPKFDEDELDREIRSHIGGMFRQVYHTIEERYMTDEELLMVVKMRNLNEKEAIQLVRKLKVSVA